MPIDYIKRYALNIEIIWRKQCRDFNDPIELARAAAIMPRLARAGIRYGEKSGVSGGTVIPFRAEFVKDYNMRDEK